MRWPQLKIKNKKTAIFLACLGISAFFWLLIKLSKEYEITVKLPVKYSNYPEDKLLLNKPDSILLLKFTDNGFDLIPYSLFGPFTKLNIDVQKLYFRQLSNDKSVYYTRTEFLSEEINNKLSSNNYISIIRPDSLVLKMVDLKQKKVSIVPDISFSLSPQFQLKKNIFCQPDSILIFGSAETLSNIDNISTEKLVFSNLNKSLEEKTNLLLPPNTKSKIKNTVVNVEVEKFTESKIQIPLKNHFKANQNFKIFPVNLDIKYAVSFDNFEKVKAKDFKIKITKDTITKGRLNIKLISYPEYIRVIDYHPKIAEYIIIK